MLTNGFAESVQLINDVEHRQRYSQLCEHFKGTLRDRDGEKFIECDRAKGYRLSIHPALVTFDEKKLLTDLSDGVRKLDSVIT
jgi:hypothetical protein